MTTNREIAESAVDKFHSQFNSGSYETIHLFAADEFKTAGGTEKDYLQKAHEVLGKVTSTIEVTSSVQNLPDEAQVHLVYVTTFANGQAPETFIFRVKDKRASLMHYEVAFKGPTD